MTEKNTHEGKNSLEENKKKLAWIYTKTSPG